MGDFFETDASVESGNAGDAVRGLDCAAFLDTVVAVVRRGWMLSVGGSRDGYSVGLTLWADGKQVAKKYYTDSASMETALSSILGRAESPPAAQAPKGGRKRS